MNQVLDKQADARDMLRRGYGARYTAKICSLPYEEVEAMSRELEKLFLTLYNSKLSYIEIGQIFDTSRQVARKICAKAIRAERRAKDAIK